MLQTYCTIFSPDMHRPFVDIWYYFMEIQIMAMDESYLKALAAHNDRGNYREEFVNALSKIFADVKLGGVRSCLAIGPGDGWFEIQFIKHSGANISKFIGIEPDHASAEHLRTSLRSRLPGAESQVFETTVQNWEGPDIPVDLITMFQVLYHVHVSAGERQECLKKIHDSWLVSGGYVAVVTASRTKSPHSPATIYERLGSPHPTWEEIEADFLKAGFTKHYEHEMHVKKDFTDPGENLLPFYQPYFKKGSITVADLRDAMKGPFSEGKKVEAFATMAIFRSTN